MTAELLAFLQAQTCPFSIKVRVLPHVQKTEVVEQMEDGTWKIRLMAPAVEGKANAALEKFFTKTLGKKIRIISGKKSREKLIKIEE